MPISSPIGARGCSPRNILWINSTNGFLLMIREGYHKTQRRRRRGRRRYTPLMPLAPGFRLGDFEITAPLGAGGMGEVYRAIDHSLGREVALKIIPVEDPESIARFEREARAVAALSHPNVLQVHRFGV